MTFRSSDYRRRQSSIAYSLKTEQTSVPEDERKREEEDQLWIKIIALYQFYSFQFMFIEKSTYEIEHDILCNLMSLSMYKQQNLNV